MKKHITKLLTFTLCLLSICSASSAQNLTGPWRLKKSTKIKGPDYANAIPLLISIEQKGELITIENTSSLGDRDTIVKESLHSGEKEINQSITKTGKKKLVTFHKTAEDGPWLKQTKIFTKTDTSKLQSLNKETYALSADGVSLSLLREYANYDGTKGDNESFAISGDYEKVTSEQLVKETAIGKGVNFTQGLNWEQISTKAKAENRYIFLDCYATWCGPCKLMDKYVYPLNIVGDAINRDFIAVKVQMDSTKSDDPSIRLLYPLARKLETIYNINALPTYLVFSPDGKIVHKGMGKLDPKDFIKLLAKAKDPQQQLYTLFEKAKQQRLLLTEYPALAKRLKEEFGEKEMAKEVAGIYNKQYLNKLSEKDLLNKKNLDFIGDYSTMVKSSDKIFQLCFKQPSLVDTIKEYHGGGWAEFIVNRTINRENIEPVLLEAEKSSQEPNWGKLEEHLIKKYNKELAITYVLDTRVSWYAKMKNWMAYFQYLKPQLARHDLKKLDPNFLHSCAWKVFKYSSDTSLIVESLEWVDMLIDKWDKESVWMVMDTKACLLYKTGRREDGIKIMNRITEMFPQFNYSFLPRLENMKKGENIWLTF